jgi:hypothetical protein
MKKIECQELASELYEATNHYLNEVLLEMLYTSNIIEDTGDDAIDLMNQIMKEFLNKQITKNW